MKINQNIVFPNTEITAVTPSTVEDVPSNAAEEKTAKLTQEMDAKACLGRSMLPKRPARKAAVVKESEFYSEILKRKCHFYEDERKGLQELAKIEDDLYDTSVIDTAKELKEASLINGEECSQVDAMLRFLRTENKIDKNLKTKVLNFIEEQPYFARSIADLQYYGECSAAVKEKILDLNIKLHNDFYDIKLSDSDFFSDNITEFLNKYIKTKLPENEQITRIQKISDLSDKIYYIDPLNTLFNHKNYYDCSKQEAQKLAQDFLDSNIFPTEGAVKEYIKDPDAFSELTKIFASKNIKHVNLDSYAINSVLKSKDSKIFKSLAKTIDKLDKTKTWCTAINENSLNPSQVQIIFADITKSKKADSFKIVYDKKTETVLYKQNLLQNPKEITIKTDVPSKGYFSFQKFNLDMNLEEETSIQKDKDGKELYKDYIKQSPVDGQYDFYRIYPDGTIESAAKAFKDPKTGETIIRQRLRSFNGTQTIYDYKGTKKGNYTFDYTIKDKDGNILMGNRQKYKFKSLNRFESEWNGQKYDIVYKNNILTVTPEGKEPVRIDMKQLVPNNNQSIIDTIIHLPGHELINLQQSTVSKVLNTYEKDNASHQTFFEDSAPVINLGKNTENSRFIFLHELGHNKDLRISKDDYKKLLAVYNKELDIFNKNTSNDQALLISYLIDTDHYLKEDKGAIREAIADINSHTILPIDSAVAGIRTLKFRQHFPQTIACAYELLNKKYPKNKNADYLHKSPFFTQKAR